MKIIYLLILLITPISISNSFLGGATPFIQAVCKITMQNNQVIEGFFNIGGGGINYYYKADGIYLYFKEHNTHQLRSFDLEFDDFKPNNLRSYREGQVDIYYAKNISRSGHELTSKLMRSKDGRVLTKELNATHKYELVDSITIFSELPSHLLLSIVEKNDKSRITVNVKEIKEILFYEHPPEKWLNKINEAQKKNDSKQYDNEDWEYIYIEWYHDILKDKERTNFLMRYF